MIRHIKKIIQNYLFELSVIVCFYFKDLIGFKVEKVLVKLLSRSKLAKHCVLSELFQFRSYNLKGQCHENFF